MSLFLFLTILFSQRCLIFTSDFLLWLLFFLSFWVFFKVIFFFISSPWYIFFQGKEKWDKKRKKLLFKMDFSIFKPLPIDRIIFLKDFWKLTILKCFENAIFYETTTIGMVKCQHFFFRKNVYFFFPYSVRNLRNFKLEIYLIEFFNKNFIGLAIGWLFFHMMMKGLLSLVN